MEMGEHSQNSNSDDHVSSKMCNCAVPPDHSRSEIHSRARATFQNVAEARKQDVI